MHSFISVEPKGFKISFSNVYGNHMVLQRAPKSATVWGFVTGLKADDVVKVFMGSQTFHASLSPGEIKKKNCHTTPVL